MILKIKDMRAGFPNQLQIQFLDDYQQICCSYIDLLLHRFERTAIPILMGQTFTLEFM